VAHLQPARADSARRTVRGHVLDHDGQIAVGGRQHDLNLGRDGAGQDEVRRQWTGVEGDLLPRLGRRRLGVDLVGQRAGRTGDVGQRAVRRERESRGPRVGRRPVGKLDWRERSMCHVRCALTGRRGLRTPGVHVYGNALSLFPPTATDGPLRTAIDVTSDRARDLGGQRA
jgi:hypothetical protein